MLDDLPLFIAPPPRKQAPPPLTKDDKKRLGKQAAAIRDLMMNGNWWTLAHLQRQLGAQGIPAIITGVSARIRQLKALGYVIQRQQLQPGLHAWRLTGEVVEPQPKQPKPHSCPSCSCGRLVVPMEKP